MIMVLTMLASVMGAGDYGTSTRRRGLRNNHRGGSRGGRPGSIDHDFEHNRHKKQSCKRFRKKCERSGLGGHKKHFKCDGECDTEQCCEPVTTTAAPTTAAPTTAAPTTASPTTPAPATAVPTTAGPTTASPTTPAPTTAAPSTATPTTAEPTTPAPTTPAPTTPAPTTPAPTTPTLTTAAPTTAAPSETYPFQFTGSTRLDVGTDVTILGCSDSWIYVEASGSPTIQKDELLLVLNAQDGVKYSDSLVDSCRCFPLMRKVVEVEASQEHNGINCSGSSCWILSSELLTPLDTISESNINDLGLTSVQSESWESFVGQACLPISDNNGRKLLGGCKSKWEDGSTCPFNYCPSDKCYFCSDRGEGGCDNGCGPESFPGIATSLVAYLTGYGDACCNHDYCWLATQQQDECNDRFLKDALTSCGIFRLVNNFISCNILSYVLYGLIRVAGQDPYDIAVKEQEEWEKTCQYTTKWQDATSENDIIRSVVLDADNSIVLSGYTDVNSLERDTASIALSPIDYSEQWRWQGGSSDSTITTSVLVNGILVLGGYTDSNPFAPNPLYGGATQMIAAGLNSQSGREIWRIQLGPVKNGFGADNAFIISSVVLDNGDVMMSGINYPDGGTSYAVFFKVDPGNGSIVEGPGRISSSKTNLVNARSLLDDMNGNVIISGFTSDGNMFSGLYSQDNMVGSWEWYGLPGFAGVINDSVLAGNMLVIAGVDNGSSNFVVAGLDPSTGEHKWAWNDSNNVGGSMNSVVWTGSAVVISGCSSNNFANVNLGEEDFVYVSIHPETGTEISRWQGGTAGKDCITGSKYIGNGQVVFGGYSYGDFSGVSRGGADFVSFITSF